MNPMLPQGVYRHYKGGEYELIDVGFAESDEKPVAIYKSLDDGRVWVRPFSEFVGETDGGLRFRYVGKAVAKHPLVGIGVMIWKEGKVLMGQRKGAHGAGEWSWPGGHFEYMESFEECARREVREETGLEITNIRFLRLLNLKDYAPRHYVDIAMVADWASGEPEVREPDKMVGWQWCAPDAIPKPCFSALPTYFAALETGRNFWDA